MNRPPPITAMNPSKTSVETSVSVLRARLMRRRSGTRKTPRAMSPG
jgi:hypothetical protein